MAGQRQVAPEARAFQRPSRAVVRHTIDPGARALVKPAMPRGLGPEAKRAWRALWASPVASAWTQGEWPVVERYILNFDEWHKARAIVIGTPLVRGSKGQVVPNPLGARLAALEAALRHLEDRLGLNLQSRFRLNLQVVKAVAGRDRLSEILSRRELRRVPVDVTPAAVEVTT